MTDALPFVVSVIDAASFTTTSRQRVYKTQLVWANDAPRAMLRALDSRDSAAIKKHYGVDLLAELGPPRPATGANAHLMESATAIAGRPSVAGGYVGAPSSSWIERDGDGTDDREEDTAHETPTQVGGADDIFTAESLGEALNEAESKRAIDARRRAGIRYAPPRQLTFSRSVNVVKDVIIGLDDNMATLKKKIQLASGIPTYRQHLWYEVDGRIISPCFSLYINESRVPVNIWDLKAGGQVVIGMPVSTDAYKARGVMRIRNTEFSTTLGGICGSDAGVSGAGVSGAGVSGAGVGGAWFVVDLNDFIGDREAAAATIKADIYVRELVYYSFVMRYWPCITANVFQTFAANEPILHDEYPELAFDTKMLERQFTMEASIISTNPWPSLKTWPINVYIEESDITSIGAHYNYGAAVNLRALFDSFKLSAETPNMFCRTALAGRMYQLTKKWRGGWAPSHKQKIAADTLSIMIHAPSLGELFFIIDAAGLYHVRARWREDQRMTIDRVNAATIELGNRIIARINALGESVVTRPLSELTPSNIDTIDASVVMIIQQKFSVADYAALKANLNQFKQAGFVRITTTDANTTTFHMLRGMFAYDDARFDSISNTLNGYEFATSISVYQRWEAIYLRQKTSAIINRSADLYVRASGIKYGEVGPFIRYMLMLAQMPTNTTTNAAANAPATTTDAAGRKPRAIAHLKESDPLLYDLKKLYKQRVQYSQICQKPNQPILVDKPSKKTTTFWNFTRGEPAYYECPSDKFPSLYFKTGVHPEHYCIPCCKKSDLSTGSKHEAIFTECMKTHKYMPPEKTAATASTYVVSYTMDLEPGRLSYLPESSLDQLFYQQYSASGKPVDSECIAAMALGYYLYGIPQAAAGGIVAGLINTIAHALDKSPADFLNDTAAKLTAPANANLWPLIMDGRILNDYRTPADFITALSAPAISAATYNFNEPFIWIARLYWGVNIIIFIDTGTRTRADDAASGSGVHISIPAGIKHVDEVISSQHKHLIVVTTTMPATATIPATPVYLPVYLVDLNEYKKTGAITQRLFDATDKAIDIVRKMMSAIIGQHIAPGIDLERILSFVDGQDSRFKLVTALINRRNTCYAVMLRDTTINALNRSGGSEPEPEAGVLIYCPIVASLHDHLDLPRTTTPFDRASYTTTFAQTLPLLDALGLKVAIWLLFDDHVQHSGGSEHEPKAGVLIGFQDTARQYNWYVAPMSREDAATAAAVETVRLMYDPVAVNAAIDTIVELPKRPTNILEGVVAAPQALYDHYKYKLFVLEFIAAMNAQSNTEVRKKISTIIRRDIKTPSIMLAGLREVLVESPADYDHILAVLSKFTAATSCESSDNAQYGALIGNKRAMYDADTILGIIDQSRFSFDDIALAALQNAPSDQLSRELDAALKPLVDVADGLVSINAFPEPFTSCRARPADYCTRNRLRVSAADYALFRDQLARDIKNPLKSDKLMLLMTRATGNELSFVNRPDEHIYVALA